MATCLTLLFDFLSNDVVLDKYNHCNAVSDKQNVDLIEIRAYIRLLCFAVTMQT